MDKDIAKNKNQQIRKPESTDNPLSSIELPDKLVDDLLIDTVGEAVLKEIPFISKFFGIIQSYKKKLDDARLYILLREFKNKHDTEEKFQIQLKKLITTPSGINLFQKIVRILNADIFDINYVKLLATVLKNISDSSFDKLFDKHNYTLSQIEKLSPQALFLIHDKSTWPQFSFSSTTVSNQILGEGWAPAFIKTYFGNKGIIEESKIQHGIHAIRELNNAGFVKIEKDRLYLTDIGENIYEYIICPQTTP